MLRFLAITLLVVSASAAPEHYNNVRLEPAGTGRIVGGSSITIQQAPYQVSLQYRNSHICGGTLISPVYVVTAAHCTDGNAANTLTIRAGSTNRGSGGTVVNVQTVNQHPSFNDYIIDYDISILRLASTLPLGSTIGTATLPSSEPAAGTSVFVTGWGTLVENGNNLPTALQGVTVDVVSSTSCASSYYQEQITARMLCAGVNGGGKDACQGDSGGPLVSGSNNLVGIVSWGYGCARSGYPGVYSNVASLRSYITQITGI